MSKNNNNIIIALGIICVILSAGLIAVVANYSGRPSTDDLESQVTSLQNQINSLNSKVSDYEKQIDDLTDENKEYASIIALEENMVLIGGITYEQDIDNETVISECELYYAGYLEIQVESTSDTTYIQVSYKHNDLEFNQTVTVGQEGTAYFPVLPGDITIILGNTETDVETETVDTTVTVTYIF
ncbi:MAG: hypothetical protein LBE70_04195 [Nitrososphaerota archaeon]|jgi:cell division protein FtsB|nr:hypothetical protein [Nitrososphaerota archaeon]